MEDQRRKEMFGVEPIVVLVAVCGTVIFMREMPRLFALLIILSLIHI